MNDCQRQAAPDGKAEGSEHRGEQSRAAEPVAKPSASSTATQSDRSFLTGSKTHVLSRSSPSVVSMGCTGHP